MALQASGSPESSGVAASLGRGPAGHIPIPLQHSNLFPGGLGLLPRAEALLLSIGELGRWGRQAVTLSCGQGSAGGAGSMGSSGTEAGWRGAPPTGNNNSSNQGTEHFHTSFLTSPTTPLEAAEWALLLCPELLLRVLGERVGSKTSKALKNSCPGLTFPFWGP